VRRTQQGNNNVYCQDNQISWFDWTLVERHAGLLRFFQRMIAFRKSHPALWRGQFFSSEVNGRGLPDVTWHGATLGDPDWSDPEARVLAMTLAGFDGDADLHVMMNMFWEPVEFQLPKIPGRTWRIAIDTWQLSPADIADPGHEPPVDGDTCTVEPRSIVVLVN